MARALHRSRRRVGNRRTDALYRNGARDPIPPSSGTRQAGTRLPGEPGTLARTHHRRAIMNDRLAGRPVSPPARASARKRANTDDGTRRETSRRAAMSAEERAKVRRAGAEDARRSRIEQG